MEEIEAHSDILSPGAPLEVKDKRGTQPRRPRRSSQRSRRKTEDVTEAKWRKWFQEERVASGGKGCFTKCERTRN